MDLLAKISMKKVYDHYTQRDVIHRRLLDLFKKQEMDQFARLAVGVSDPQANYSASEYGGGVQILQGSSARSVYLLAEELYNCRNPNHIPDIIYHTAIRYLKISVGSEIAMMLRPDDFWVANVRTIWAYLLIKHGDNYSLVNEELTLYRAQDRDSEMHYDTWADLHRLLETTQIRLHDLGIEEATRQKAPIGALKYLWADAIANELYERRQQRARRS